MAGVITLVVAAVTLYGSCRAGAWIGCKLPGMARGLVVRLGALVVLGAR